MIDKETKEAAPVTAFINADRLAKDVARINDAARGKWLSIVGVTLALLRNYKPDAAPTHFKIKDLLQKFDKSFGATGRSYGKVGADRTMADTSRSAAPGPLELPLHRRHVVPGSTSTTTSAAPSSVHHPLRHTRG